MLKMQHYGLAILLTITALLLPLRTAAHDYKDAAKNICTLLDEAWWGCSLQIDFDDMADETNRQQQRHDVLSAEQLLTELTQYNARPDYSSSIHVGTYVAGIEHYSIQMSGTITPRGLYTIIATLNNNREELGDGLSIEVTKTAFDYYIEGENLRQHDRPTRLVWDFSIDGHASSKAMAAIITSLHTEYIKSESFSFSIKAK